VRRRIEIAPKHIARITERRLRVRAAAVRDRGGARGIERAGQDDGAKIGTVGRAETAKVEACAAECVGDVEAGAAHGGAKHVAASLADDPGPLGQCARVAADGGLADVANGGVLVDRLSGWQGSEDEGR